MIKLFEKERFDQIKHALIIDTTQKWIYFNIGRTGGTSVYRRCLEKRFKDPIKAEDFLDEWVKTITVESVKEYFGFTFVRNPFDRVVSVAIRFKEMGLIDVSVKEFVYDLEKYIPVSGKPKNLTVFQHGKPCSLYTHVNGEQALCFVGRLEDVQNDFIKLTTFLKIPLEEVPHIHKSERDRNYRNYYNDKMIEIVSKRYADDLRLFNYKF